jgi:Spy/CpxP family protein refolding chaperone
MRKCSLWFGVLAVVALAASPALAQRQQRGGGQPPGGRFGGGFGGGPLMLLGQKSVQEELKLTEDQIKQVTDATAKQREARQGLRDLSQEERTKKMQELNKEGEKVVQDVLKPDQAKRLHQIVLQQQGARAFADPKVAKELNLTEDQTKKIKDIQDDSRKQMQELFQGGGGGDRQEAAKKMAELNKATSEKAMNVLTAEQKTKWKEMTGEPFKGQLQPFGGGRGGAPRRDLRP